MRYLGLFLLGLLFCGCGPSQPEIVSSERTITHEEWKNLPPEERNDPYVLQHLKPSKK